MFRSHLMQQFAAAAGGQSRPPLTLASVTTATRTYRRSGASTSSRGPSPTAFSTTTPTDDARLAKPVSKASERRRVVTRRCVLGATTTTTKSLSVAAAADADATSSSKGDDDQDTTTTRFAESTTIRDDSPSESALFFQSLIQSRRTTSRWTQYHDQHNISNNNLSPQHVFFSDALDRAIHCARHAPNHKRTEPFRFVRLLRNTNDPSDSSPIDHLADICYHVTLQQRRLSQDPLQTEKVAASKRDKWASIPAYLVALTEQAAGPSNQGDGHDDDGVLRPDGLDAFGDYEELPFVPPRTERQLEDYASAAAAVQNILLSLHAEGLGTKWATGPVVRTHAFRQLCRVREMERVVGLIMVGTVDPARNSSAAKMKPRRYRRSWENLVQDL